MEVEFETKTLPVNIIQVESPVEIIRLYKCQVMTCIKRAESTLDFEWETMAHLVCTYHLIKVAEGDMHSQIFLSDVIWLYDLWLDLQRILHYGMKS